VALHSSNYVLGPAAIGLGSRALGQVDVRRLAAPVLRKLRDDTNETATLSLLAGHSRIYVDQYESPQEVKMVVEIGPRFPLHSGASSRSILAFLGDQFVVEAIEQLAAEVPDLDEAAYRERLAAVRLEGFAVSLNERKTGAASIAAPFFDSAGNVLGSVSSSGPVARYGQTQSEHIQQVVDAAAAITTLVSA
jgi:DNA-binding IclR family transcriptional regulator